MKEKLTQSELKRQLHYDPLTGIFTWINSNSLRVRTGDTAGCSRKDGYIRIKINGKNYLAHRLAWLYMEGYFPEHHIDHKFGIRDDNRWSELQHATRSCNMQNQAISTCNSSGFPGVALDRTSGKWRSRIIINQKVSYLGHYDDPLEAALARFTVETQCPKWTCNHRSELVKAIRSAWPEFRGIV